MHKNTPLIVKIKIGTIFLKGNLVTFIKSLKNAYTFDLEIHLLGIYSKEIEIVIEILKIILIVLPLRIS